MTRLMQMGYDFEYDRQAATSAARLGGFAEPWPVRGDRPADASAGHPDWSALRSRFMALHALRRSLAGSATADLPAGGFAAAAEAVLATCRNELVAVNFVCSGNGKGDSAMTYPVAGSPTSGDRGIQ